MGGCRILSHSKYGISKNIRSNNHSDYKTGYSSVKELVSGSVTQSDYGITSDKTQPWNTEIGYLASTTGNITGIYDMAGGALEYTMAVMLNSSNTKPCSSSESKSISGFNGPYCLSSGSFINGIDFPELKYYDRYLFDSNQNDGDKHYNRRILGDATGELGPFQSTSSIRVLSSWYSQEGLFVYDLSPWFYRGSYASYVNVEGIFSFGRDYGQPGFNRMIRIVLMS